MKYMLMMTPKAVFEWFSKWPKEDLKANLAFMRDFNKELKDSGVLVATEGLAFPDQAKIVRAGETTGHLLLPMDPSLKPKSFSPDSGSLT